MILLLEDDIGFSIAVERNLKISIPGIEISVVYNIPNAKDVYENYKSKIKCYIIDLNMRLHGLNFPDKTDKEIQAITRNGRISGFLWFEQFVLKEESQENFKKALFVTAYQEQLREHLESEYNTSGFNIEDFEGKILPKADVQERPDMLSEKVFEIYKQYK